VQLFLQWESKNITYAASVFIALVMPQAIRLRHAVICDLSGSKVFFHIISQMAR
jgi:hypothetical protein